MMISSLWASTQFTFGRFPHYLRLKNLGNSFFTPFVQIDFENEFYQVKTINSALELREVLQLRYEVFYKEFASEEPVFSLFKIDVDVHDFICDHLVVKDKSTQKIVACYRLLSSDLGHRIKHFYSESEFDLREFLKLPGKKLELGRACVDRNYRSGTVVAMLWKGLVEYARKSQTRFMFGCSSINRKDFENYHLIMDHLEKNNHFITDFKIGVRPKFTARNVEIPPAPVDKKGRFLNSIMSMYLMAGAKIGKTCAYDAEMDCLDLFTVMDFNDLPPSFERRFSC